MEDRATQREIFQLLFHFLSVCNKQAWIGLNPGTMNFIWVFPVCVVNTKVLESSPAGNWAEVEAVPNPGHSDVRFRYLKQ